MNPIKLSYDQLTEINGITYRPLKTAHFSGILSSQTSYGTFYIDDDNRIERFYLNEDYNVANVNNIDNAKTLIKLRLMYNMILDNCKRVLISKHYDNFIKVFYAKYHHLEFKLQESVEPISLDILDLIKDVALPCPICGKQPRLQSRNKSVLCTKGMHDVRIVGASSLNTALNIWNTRN